jgi:hypothetical protein
MLDDLTAAMGREFWHEFDMWAEGSPMGRVAIGFRRSDISDISKAMDEIEENFVEAHETL